MTRGKDQFTPGQMKETSTWHVRRPGCCKHKAEKTLGHRITFHAIIGKTLAEFIHHNEGDAEWIAGAKDFLFNKEVKVEE